MTERRGVYAVKSARAVKPPSELEAVFILHLKAEGMAALFEREVMIIPERKYVFDFVCADYKIAIELQGGTWKAGTGHNTGAGLSRDYDKSNLAQMLGWLVLMFDTNAVRNGQAIQTVRAAVERAAGGEL